MAREAVTEFRDQLEEPTYTDLRLVVSELVADAARAGVDGVHELSLRIEVGDGFARVMVNDGVGAYRLKSRRPPPGEPGWGAYLARTLGRRWGTRQDGQGGSIWVEMERPDPH